MNQFLTLSGSSVPVAVLTKALDVTMEISSGTCTHNTVKTLLVKPLYTLSVTKESVEA